MTTRKDLIREYKERRKPAGIYRITNTANGKVLLGSSLNLEGVLNGQRFRLDTGSHRNAVLQQEWKSFGADAFVLDIVEEVKFADDPHFNVEDELALLEEIWLEKLEPYGDRGYNTPGGKIRSA
ncbi:MAG: GIY-YIG nuclease family protein [Bacteroidota bacterium]|jgi:hypothetical protein|nr:GIY-YIG nuclease family protein [Bacteroidota bacterium]